MADFIDPSWIKTSEYPPNFLPAGSIVIDQASEDGDCTVKGFYDPKTGEYHIQEVLHNVEFSGTPGWQAKRNYGVMMTEKVTVEQQEDMK